MEIKHSNGSTEVEASRWKHRKKERDCCVDVVINLQISAKLRITLILTVLPSERTILEQSFLLSCYCVSYQYYLHILSFVCIEY